MNGAFWCGGKTTPGNSAESSNQNPHFEIPIMFICSSFLLICCWQYPGESRMYFQQPSVGTEKHFNNSHNLMIKWLVMSVTMNIWSLVNAKKLAYLKGQKPYNIFDDSFKHFDTKHFKGFHGVSLFYHKVDNDFIYWGSNCHKIYQNDKIT